MKVIFVTNYYTHHQSSLAKYLFENQEVDFVLIETETITEERVNMGWKLDDIPSFVINNNEFNSNIHVYEKMILDADIVIFGSVIKKMLRKRLSLKKPTFLYTERLYKKKVPFYKFPVHFLKFYMKKYMNKNLYALCASAYASNDFSKTFSLINRCYKWGYFPPIQKYDNIEKLILNKHKNSIMWCGRFIWWKHPEKVIEIAKRLKERGVEFTINMIGNGPLEPKISLLIKEFKLEKNVFLLGSMKPEKVREYMEKSEMFLCTSDRNEGWGAVLNESMNSACAVVASHAIGSVPFIIKNGVNGMIFRDDRIMELYEKIELLLSNKDDRIRIAKNAYQTIITEWNANIASYRLLELFKAIIAGNKKPSLYQDGLCSKAEIIKDNWYL